MLDIFPATFKSQGKSVPRSSRNQLRLTLTNVLPHNSVSGPNPVYPYWPLQQRAPNEVKGAGNDAISSDGRLLNGFVSGEGGYFGRIFPLFLYPSYIWEEAVAELGISHLIGILLPTNWKKVTRAR